MQEMLGISSDRITPLAVTVVRRQKASSLLMFSLLCFHSSTIFRVIPQARVFYYLSTEQSISRTWAKVEDSRRRDLLLQAFSQRSIMGRTVLSDDTQKISGHCQALELMAR